MPFTGARTIVSRIAAVTAAAAVVLATVTAPVVLAAQDAGKTAPDAIAQQVQAHYQTIQDFTADFSHTYEGGVLRKKTTERGTLAIKKPGKMRWAYAAPEEKLFVSDGKKIYSYVPADKQVTVSTMPADDRASTPILFLVGKGDLVRDYTVTHAEPLAGVAFPADTHALKLVPRTKVAEYEWIILVVDRQSLKLRMLVTRDAQSGTSAFTFANLKENVGVPDARFTFTIPRGADVITQS
jgi:outer membrane lipoprotein carrier protein